jgi:cellulose synthase/poly-beta-1,6-N-acetylglucosamine synthase-like glycosyltransferase
MPQVPGLPLMPITLLNAALGLLPDRTLPVRGPDRIAAVVPMFDEEAGAARALASLLGQRVPVYEIVVSINGGSDRTPVVVADTLAEAGYAPVARSRWGATHARVRWWWRLAGGPAVTVVEHDRPVSKADGINEVVAGGLVTSERVLILDGDTVLDPGFVEAMRDGHHRLRRVGRGGAGGYVLEDVAIQSGAVTSLRPTAPGAAAHWVSAARSAEYAFATLVRRGQVARLGRGAIFGSSRLYTVIGCGFVARRDAFPIPADTLTEDHDLTLAVQAGPRSARVVDVTELHQRGFRVVLDGEERPLAEVVGDGPVELRTTAEARFEAGAAMGTEDPPRLPAYLGQVERWVGGGLENLLKRVLGRDRPRAWTPNVRFAVLGAQLENLLGVLLLVGLPAILGVAWPWGGAAAVGRGLAAWLAFDVAVTGALVLAGAWYQARAPGRRPLAALGLAARRTLVGIVPLLLLRPINAAAYVAAATRVVPAFLRSRARAVRVTVTWERPRAIARAPRARIAGVTGGMLAVAVLGFTGSAHLAWSAVPVEPEVWRDLRAGPRVELEAHLALPVVSVVVRDVVTDASAPSDGDLVPGFSGPAPAAQPVSPMPPRSAPPRSVSLFCGPHAVASAAPEPRRFGEEIIAYEALGPWGLLTLARLTPLVALIEDAASAYDVPPVQLLQLLLNESYLDPLAIGPTDDVGLSQVTGDTLTLLRTISEGGRSRFANPQLFARPFSAYDPDFSICAGAAKLAWARHLPHGADDEVAYARYVNPLHGVVDGRVSDRHRPLVDAYVTVRPMAEGLAAAVAAYRASPELVTAAEASLLAVADAVARREMTVEDAYRRTSEVAERLRIDDAAFYERVISGLYGEPSEIVTLPAWTLAAR